MPSVMVHDVRIMAQRHRGNRLGGKREAHDDSIEFTMLVATKFLITTISRSSINTNHYTTFLHLIFRLD